MDLKQHIKVGNVSITHTYKNITVRTSVRKVTSSLKAKREVQRELQDVINAKVARSYIRANELSYKERKALKNAERRRKMKAAGKAWKLKQRSNNNTLKDLINKYNK